MSGAVESAEGLRRFRPYPEYTVPDVDWLGEIPSHWETPRNKQIFREVDDRSSLGEEMLLSVSEYSGVKPRAEAIVEGEFLSRAESLVGYKRCQKDDLAMNFMLAWKTGLGFSDYDGIVSPSYAVFRFICEACPRYYHYLLRSSQAVSEFRKWSYGIIDSRLRLYPDVFLTLHSTLPPLDEQQAIAEFLDRETGKIDALVAKKERLIELLQEKRTALITHAVTKGLDPTTPTKPSGIDWLGDIPAHWEAKKLKRISPRQSVGLVINPSTYVDPEGDIPFLFGANVARFEIKLDGVRQITSDSNARLAPSMLRGSDLVTVRVGAPGVTAVVPRELDGANCASLMITRSHSSFSSDWLCYAMNSRLGDDQVELVQYGAAQKQFNIAHGVEFRYPTPPPEEQAEIVEFLDRKVGQLRRLEEKTLSAIDRLKEFRTALISAAVTGKIDVRDEVE